MKQECSGLKKELTFWMDGSIEEVFAWFWENITQGNFAETREECEEQSESDIIKQYLVVLSLKEIEE